MKALPRDTFHCLEALPGHPHVRYASLPRAESNGAGPISTLPYSLRVLVEQLLRYEDGTTVVADDITAVSEGAGRERVVPFHPARLLLQDSAGLPVLADLIALGEAVQERRGDPAAVRPCLPMDLVVDHAVEADHWGSGDAAVLNVRAEHERHHDRYRFLGWAEGRLDHLHVVPPGAGICHQLNLEVLARVARTWATPGGGVLAGFDTVLGTDSHTPMVNALSVLGWGVGGLEATAAALGEPVWLRIPEVIGVRLTGQLREGVLASDLVLSLTALLRRHDLVDRFVEFFGPGVPSLSVPDRATVSNMAPEYGATVGFFPPDERTLDYLRATGRSDEHVAFTRALLQAQGMLVSSGSPVPAFTDVVEFDLGAVAPTIAGPDRPTQRLGFPDLPATVPARTASAGLSHGDVVLAAITSCTNTSNPRAMIASGLLARAALDRDLRVGPRVKTTLAPGSRVAARMLELTGLQSALDEQGFHVAGHGCMTCMGNSGPLSPGVEREIVDGELSVAAVLSGNRNFEGRVHQLCRLVYLASPPLVVAYALAGRMDIDLAAEPLGRDAAGRPVYLADLWPSSDAIDLALGALDVRQLGLDNAAEESSTAVSWREAFSAVPEDDEPYEWHGPSGFIRRPPFVDEALSRSQVADDVVGARALLVLGDSVTTDHISPVSRIGRDSEAGRWLTEQGVATAEHASFSARRLNHDVMLRGGFANARLDNRLVPGRRGGLTRLMPDDRVVPVHEAAAAYRDRGVPMLVVAGHEYGAGSARDWAAKVTRLLGVRAVLARSFERIHRTNLLAMGVLPLQLPEDDCLALDGTETFDLLDVEEAARVGGRCRLLVHRGTGTLEVDLRSQVRTAAESGWVRRGGLLPSLLLAATAGRR